jgi:glutaredoxin
MYCKENCEYCIQAKSLLVSKGIQFEEKLLGTDFLRDFVVTNFPNSKTYPIIVNDGRVIGGYSELLSELNKGTSFGKVLLQG